MQSRKETNITHAVVESIDLAQRHSTVYISKAMSVQTNSRASAPSALPEYTSSTLLEGCHPTSFFYHTVFTGIGKS